MSDLASLIARLEAAEGPSRELDAEIAALCVIGPSQDVWAEPDSPGMVRVLGCGSISSQSVRARRYTASLDSALSLVPEGVWTTIDHYFMSDERPDIWRVWLKRPIGFDGKRPKIIEYFSKAPTPALALTAAALKARAQG